jgi:hypothetical protein
MTKSFLSTGRRIHEVRIRRPRATDLQPDAEPAADAQEIAETEKKASSRE